MRYEIAYRIPEYSKTYFLRSLVLKVLNRLFGSFGAKKEFLLKRFITMRKQITCLVKIFIKIYWILLTPLLNMLWTPLFYFRSLKLNIKIRKTDNRWLYTMTVMTLYWYGIVCISKYNTHTFKCIYS